jgi:UTP--glucose-1-phosphate uridylyltransferase
MPENNFFNIIQRKMQAENLPDIVIKNFINSHQQLARGFTGAISEKKINPVKSLPDSEQLSKAHLKIGAESLSKSATLKLNGGLGTSMGLAKAKSLLTVKNGLTFLDILAKQSIISQVPLVLMNSYSTREDSLNLLKKYPELQTKIPLDFLQHKVPKVRQDNLMPVGWPVNPQLEWCPPGHGDIYLAMVTSGMLKTLLQNGIEYLFISNGDNLGAVMDPFILGYFVKEELPFLMEVTNRTNSDRKGGHLAHFANGGLLLREIAQCPEEDKDFFQDINRHQYFNTNNLWINLNALDKLLKEKNYILDLPMIRNSKTVDPRDKKSTPVYQLETAMGSAISVFDGAQAIRVPRTRFAPVKNTNDLLAVRSDLFQLTEDFRIVPNQNKITSAIKIKLDSAFYKNINDFEKMFPFGAPSLLECTELLIEGDVIFGAGIKLENKLEIKNKSSQPARIKDNSILEGEIIF